jgi:hypothetical protein
MSHPEPLGTGMTVAVASGMTAAVLSAPFIAIVDAAITSNASGREPLWSAVKNGFSELLKKPAYFIRKPSFLWISAVYSATYVVANTTQLLCQRADVSYDMPKFGATSATNIGMSALKDRAFAKMYAARGKPASAFPTVSLGLFAARDALTIAASFTLPPRITPWVEASTGLPHDIARGLVQFVTPLGAQVFSVPMHLVALDLYNNPANPARSAFVRREYTKTLLARWGRIFPAYGIGGVINLQMQDFLNARMKADHV